MRNVSCRPTYNHIIVPLTATTWRATRRSRDWINAYVPGDKRDPSGLAGDAPVHVLWAADVWYSIKKHWCLEAQRLIRAQRDSASAASPRGERRSPASAAR